MKQKYSALRATQLLFIAAFSALFFGCARQGIYHQVQPGESLGQIARLYGQSEVLLARVNGIDTPQALQKGERLFIPGATALQRAKPVQQTVKASTPKPGQTVKNAASPSLRSAKSRKRTDAAVGKSSPPQVAKGTFIWPLQGEVLRRFGDQKPFPCKGVEIAVPVGTPVLAAAAGRVIYSGDGISSFGNMIILRHDGDFYSVYAFAQKNIAKVGTFVSQKERIALSGVPPQGRSPRLYFELRYHKEPVDPTFYLP